MFKFLNLTLHDPILLVTTLVMAAAAVILAWSLREYLGLSNRKRSDSRRPEQENEPSPAVQNPQHSQQENENIILMEAHLREMSNQLSEIGRRLLGVEKTINQKKAAEQAIPALFNNTEMEKYIQRVEAKIEGIHKLLIILTDSGNTEQK